MLRTIGLTLLALCCFAANSLLCRAALAGQHIDAVSFTVIRMVSGAVVLTAIARAQRRPAPRGRLAWGSAIALLGYALAFSAAYTRIPTGMGALLLFAAVQVTMIGAGLRAGERPRVGEWLGLACSFVGLIVLARPGLSQPDPLGALLMSLAGICWGLYSLRGRDYPDAISGNAASFLRTIPLVVLIGGVAMARHATFGDIQGVQLAIVSGAITSGLGYAIWYLALRGLSATRAALVQLGVPPLAAAGGILFLGERAGLRLSIASALILGGIAIASAARTSRSR